MIHTVTASSDPAVEAAAKADAGDPVDGTAAASTREAQLQARQMAALAKKERTFDFALEERSETEREIEALDTLFLAQLKHDDEMMKGWIKLI